MLSDSLRQSHVEGLRQRAFDRLHSTQHDREAYLECLQQHSGDDGGDALVDAMLRLSQEFTVPLPQFEKWLATLDGVELGADQHHHARLLEALVCEHSGDTAVLQIVIRRWECFSESPLPLLREIVLRLHYHDSALSHELHDLFRRRLTEERDLALVEHDYQREIQTCLAKERVEEIIREYVEWAPESHHADEHAEKWRAQISTFQTKVKTYRRLDRDVAASGGKPWVWLEYVQTAWRQFSEPNRAMFLCERAVEHAVDTAAVPVWVHYLVMMRKLCSSDQLSHVRSCVSRAVKRFPTHTEVWQECIALATSMGHSSLLKELFHLATETYKLKDVQVMLPLVRTLHDHEKEHHESMTETERLFRGLLREMEREADAYCRLSLQLAVMLDNSKYLQDASKHHGGHPASHYAWLEYRKQPHPSTEHLRNVFVMTLKGSGESGLGDKMRARIYCDWSEFEALRGTATSWVANARDKLREMRQMADLNGWCNEVVSAVPSTAAVAGPAKQQHETATRSEKKAPKAQNAEAPAAPAAPAEATSTAVYCCNFPPNVKREDVDDFFAPTKLKDVNIVSKKAQALCYVHTYSVEDATEILKKDREEFNGRKVRVQPYKQPASGAGAGAATGPQKRSRNDGGEETHGKKTTSSTASAELGAEKKEGVEAKSNSFFSSLLN